MLEFCLKILYSGKYKTFSDPTSLLQGSPLWPFLSSQCLHLHCPPQLHWPPDVSPILQAGSPTKTLCIVLPAQDLSFFSLNLCLAHLFIAFNFIYFINSGIFFPPSNTPTYSSALLFFKTLVALQLLHVLASLGLLLFCLLLLECEHYEGSDFSVLFHF